MAGDLNTIFAAVAAEIVARHPNATVEVGARYLRQHDRPPRCVFVPGSESIFQGTDGRSGTDTDPAGTRVVAVRVVSVDAHLWACKLDGAGLPDHAATEAEHLDAAEQFVADVICSAHETTWAYQVRATKGQWVEADEGATRLGYGYVLTFEWRIAVPLVESTATVTTATINKTFTT